MDQNPSHDPKTTVPGLTSAYTNGRLHPKHLQITGLVLLVASVAFWMVTGAQSVLMVSASLSLIGVGSYTTQINNLRKIVASQTEEVGVTNGGN